MTDGAVDVDCGAIILASPIITVEGGTEGPQGRQMSRTEYDITVIGGGIIGLATAMRLTQEFPDLRVAVLEKEPEIALHQTGHNSGVIHAGIYYEPGSQKANFCSIGGRMLRDFCDERGIEYKMCGKLIIGKLISR